MTNIPQRPWYKTFWANLLLVIAICLAVYWLFFASLGWITGHGKEKVIPNLAGKSVKEAVSALNNLGFDVDIDSTFDPSKQPLAVIQQQPEAGMTVKNGRTIFLLVNKSGAPKIPMPNLVNLSFRSALILLQSNKLIMGDTIYRPDIANGSVLAQQYQTGQDISPGTLIPQGSKVNLVIGNGLGTKEISVPNVVGMSYPEAVALISGSNLQYTVVFDGAISDTASAMVYSQMPEAQNDDGNDNTIQEGDIIDLRVQQNMPQPN